VADGITVGWLTVASRLDVATRFDVVTRLDVASRLALRWAAKRP